MRSLAKVFDLDEAMLRFRHSGSKQVWEIS